MDGTITMKPHERVIVFDRTNKAVLDFLEGKFKIATKKCRCAKLFKRKCPVCRDWPKETLHETEEEFEAAGAPKICERCEGVGKVPLMIHSKGPTHWHIQKVF